MADEILQTDNTTEENSSSVSTEENTTTTTTTTTASTTITIGNSSDFYVNTDHLNWNKVNGVVVDNLSTNKYNEKMPVFQSAEKELVYVPEIQEYMYNTGKVDDEGKPIYAPYKRVTSYELSKKGNGNRELIGGSDRPPHPLYVTTTAQIPNYYRFVKDKTSDIDKMLTTEELNNQPIIKTYSTTNFIENSSQPGEDGYDTTSYDLYWNASNVLAVGDKLFIQKKNTDDTINVVSNGNNAIAVDPNPSYAYSDTGEIIKLSKCPDCGCFNCTCSTPTKETTGYNQDGTPTQNTISGVEISANTKGTATIEVKTTKETDDGPVPITNTITIVVLENHFDVESQFFDVENSITPHRYWEDDYADVKEVWLDDYDPYLWGDGKYHYKDGKKLKAPNLFEVESGKDIIELIALHEAENADNKENWVKLFTYGVVNDKKLYNYNTTQEKWIETSWNISYNYGIIQNSNNILQKKIWNFKNTSWIEEDWNTDNIYTTGIKSDGTYEFIKYEYNGSTWDTYESKTTVKEDKPRFRSKLPHLPHTVGIKGSSKEESSVNTYRFHDSRVETLAGQVEDQVNELLNNDTILRRELEREHERACATESGIYTELRMEEARAKHVENSLNIAINSENARAKFEENRIETRLNDEETLWLTYNQTISTDVFDKIVNRMNIALGEDRENRAYSSIDLDSNTISTGATQTEQKKPFTNQRGSDLKCLVPFDNNSNGIASDGSSIKGIKIDWAYIKQKDEYVWYRSYFKKLFEKLSDVTVYRDNNLTLHCPLDEYELNQYAGLFTGTGMASLPQDSFGIHIILYPENYQVMTDEGKTIIFSASYYEEGQAITAYKCKNELSTYAAPLGGYSTGNFYETYFNNKLPTAEESNNGLNYQTFSESTEVYNYVRDFSYVISNYRIFDCIKYVSNDTASEQYLIFQNIENNKVETFKLGYNKGDSGLIRAQNNEEQPEITQVSWGDIEVSTYETAENKRSDWKKYNKWWNFKNEDGTISYDRVSNLYNTYPSLYFIREMIKDVKSWIGNAAFDIVVLTREQFNPTTLAPITSKIEEINTHTVYLVPHPTRHGVSLIKVENLDGQNGWNKEFIYECPIIENEETALKYYIWNEETSEWVEDISDDTVSTDYNKYLEYIALKTEVKDTHGVSLIKVENFDDQDDWNKEFIYECPITEDEKTVLKYYIWNEEASEWIEDTSIEVEYAWDWEQIGSLNLGITNIEDIIVTYNLCKTEPDVYNLIITEADLESRLAPVELANGETTEGSGVYYSKYTGEEAEELFKKRYNLTVLDEDILDLEKVNGSWYINQKDFGYNKDGQPIERTNIWNLYQTGWEIDSERLIQYFKDKIIAENTSMVVIDPTDKDIFDAYLTATELPYRNLNKEKMNLIITPNPADFIKELNYADQNVIIRDYSAVPYDKINDSTYSPISKDSLDFATSDDGSEINNIRMMLVWYSHSYDSENNIVDTYENIYTITQGEIKQALTNYDKFYNLTCYALMYEQVPENKTTYEYKNGIYTKIQSMVISLLGDSTKGLFQIKKEAYKDQILSKNGDDYDEIGKRIKPIEILENSTDYSTPLYSAQEVLDGFKNGKSYTLGGNRVVNVDISTKLILTEEFTENITKHKKWKINGNFKTTFNKEEFIDNLLLKIQKIIDDNKCFTDFVVSVNLRNDHYNSTNFNNREHLKQIAISKVENLEPGYVSLELIHRNQSYESSYYPVFDYAIGSSIKNRRGESIGATGSLPASADYGNAMDKSNTSKTYCHYLYLELIKAFDTMLYYTKQYLDLENDSIRLGGINPISTYLTDDDIYEIYKKQFVRTGCTVDLVDYKFLPNTSDITESNKNHIAVLEDVYQFISKEDTNSIYRWDKKASEIGVLFLNGVDLYFQCDANYIVNYSALSPAILKANHVVVDTTINSDIYITSFYKNAIYYFKVPKNDTENSENTEVKPYKYFEFLSEPILIDTDNDGEVDTPVGNQFVTYDYIYNVFNETKKELTDKINDTTAPIKIASNVDGEMRLNYSADEILTMWNGGRFIEDGKEVVKPAQTLEIIMSKGNKNISCRVLGIDIGDFKSNGTALYKFTFSQGTLIYYMYCTINAQKNAICEMGPISGNSVIDLAELEDLKNTLYNINEEIVIFLESKELTGGWLDGKSVDEEPVDQV